MEKSNSSEPKLNRNKDLLRLEKQYIVGEQAFNRDGSLNHNALKIQQLFKPENLEPKKEKPKFFKIQKSPCKFSFKKF
jgi:hypothetical protein